MSNKNRDVAGPRRCKAPLPAALSLLGCFVAATAAAQPSESLERELSAAGWSAERAMDGSLILRPPQPEAELPPTAGPTVQTPKAEALQDRLRARGWGVEEEADGTLILRPPAVPVVPRSGQGSVVVADEPEPQPQATAAGGGTSATSGLANALRARDWQVEEKADGTLIIRQPATAQRYESMTFDPGCGPWTAPSVADGDIDLPVNEWGEAHRIAQQWLSLEAPTGLLVGKVRKVLQVYLVSIVADRRPFELVHQVAIRSRDGRLLFIH